MKTKFNANLKDNVAAATLLTATFLAIMGSIVSSGDANANKVVPQSAVAPMEMQYMETIVRQRTAHQVGREIGNDHVHYATREQV